MDRDDDGFEDVSPEPLSEHDGGIVTSAEWFKWMMRNRREYIRRRILLPKHVDAMEEHIERWKEGKGAHANETKTNTYRASYIWDTFVTKTSESVDEGMRQRIARLQCI